MEIIKEKISEKLIVKLVGKLDTITASELRESLKDDLSDVKECANEIICFYSDNDPYVKYEKEKEFADTIATEQIVLKGAGHINAESGFDTFEDIVCHL